MLARRVSPRLFLTIIAVCCTLVTVYRASGQTPTGTVFFFSDTMKAMRPDGTEKVQVLPSVSYGHPLFPPNADRTKPYALRGNPCDQVQGSDPFQDRWFLAIAQTDTYDEVTRSTGATTYNVPHYDLFAYRANPSNRSEVIAVQLTNLFGMYTFPSSSQVDWSNDSNESAATSFVASYGTDIRAAYSETILPDGSYYSKFNADLRKSIGFRLPMTASYIQLQWLSGMPPYRPQTPTELTSLLISLAGDSRTTSPDGLIAALGQPERTLSLFSSFDRTVALRVLWNGTGTSEPKWPANPVWSRDGNTIAFINAGNSAESSSGGVWSMPAAGGTAPRQLAKNVPNRRSLARYSSPLWAPDSRFMAILLEDQKATWRTSTTTFDVMRIPAAGGTLVNLTADITANAFSYRWVSNQSAPLAP